VRGGKRKWREKGGMGWEEIGGAIPQNILAWNRPCYFAPVRERGIVYRYESVISGTVLPIATKFIFVLCVA